MVLSGFSSASSRRRIVAFSFAAAALATNAIAQQPPAPAAPAAGQTAPPAAAPAAPDPLKFTTGVGGIIFYVKPDKTADFEAVWATIKTKFSASDNPEFKALGDGLKFYKLSGPPTEGLGAMYLFLADPASKTISYNPSPSLLFESKLFADAEARDLLAKLSAALAQINPLPLMKVQ